VTAHRLAILDGPPAFPDGLPLLRPTLPPFEAVRPGLERAFASGMLTKGPALAEYERRLADHLGVRHAVAVSSCTAGLTLLFDRFGGGEAILPSFTFMATALAAARAGLTPVFADIDESTWCMDPQRAEDLVSERTAVIVPVHVFGNPADTDAYDALGRRTGVPLVYDAAHGFGALRDGRPVGREGLAQVFSTSPTKLLITGEGGVVATDDDEVAERIVVGREYGNPGDYDALFVGMNARLPEAGALLGIAGLDLLDAEARRRNDLAALYHETLAEVPGVCFQSVRPQDRSSYKDVSIRLGPAFGLSRDGLAAALLRDGVHTRAYYVPAAHRLTAFAPVDPAVEARLPRTAALEREVLTLPCYGSMSEEHVRRVAAVVVAAQARAADVRRALAGKV
jgi:dTDP-4-amino-4,6-dideoxygalactose transaminase